MIFTGSFKIVSIQSHFGSAQGIAVETDEAQNIKGSVLFICDDKTFASFKQLMGKTVIGVFYSS